MFRKELAAWVTAAAVALAATAEAQVIIQKDSAPLAIDAAACDAVIDAVLKALDEEYVFPETAAKMIKAIRKRQADKDYSEVKTGQELARLLTEHLQEVSKDKHLRVMCSTDKLPKPPNDNGPTPEMREKRRQMALKWNAGYRTVERLGGNVGYLALDGFGGAEAAAEPAAAAMNFLANTDALIIDLRRNGGGSPDGVALLCSYFFDDKPVHLNSLYWRKGNRTEEFWTRRELAGKRYTGKDVYVLTSARTFSGAEEFAYNLQTQKRATIVGETTGGGPTPAAPGRWTTTSSCSCRPAGRSTRSPRRTGKAPASSRTWPLPPTRRWKRLTNWRSRSCWPAPRTTRRGD
jgi:hypothetical protein